MSNRTPTTDISKASKKPQRGGTQDKRQDDDTVVRGFTPDTSASSGGEGDRNSDRAYREHTEKFVNSPDGKEAIRHAGDVSEEQRADIERAEERGRSHAKEFDPQESVDFKRKN